MTWAFIGRDRFWLFLGGVVVALALGLATGWWLRGGDTKAPQAASSAAPQSRVPSTDLQPAAVPARPEDRELSMAARNAARADTQSRTPAASGTAEPPALADPVGDAPAAERLLDAALLLPTEGLEDPDAEQRARDRREDFDEFGDGPVARQPTADPAEVAQTVAADCLPLGARGCRRDVDCCDAGICRTQAGEIAGFRECREAR